MVIIIRLGAESDRSPSASRTPQRAKVLRPLLKQWTRAQRREGMDLIAAGIAAGRTNSQIVRDMLKSRGRKP